MATSRRWGWIAPAAVLIAAAIYAGRTVVVHNEVDAARLRALEARLALLEAHPRANAGGSRPGASEPHLVVPVAPTEASEPESEAPAPAAPPPQLTTKPTAIDEVALQRAYFGELDARLASETRDPVWAAATEELLRGSTRDLRPRLNVEAAECGQTMCRVETSAVDPQDEMRALEKFLTTNVATLPEAVIRAGDQPGRRIVYFARPGQSFPALSADPESATP